MSVPKTAPCSSIGVIRESNPETLGLSSPCPTPRSTRAPTSPVTLETSAKPANPQAARISPVTINRSFAKARDQPADQPPLHDRAQEAQSRRRRMPRSAHPSAGDGARTARTFPRTPRRPGPARKPIRMSRPIPGSAIVSSDSSPAHGASRLARRFACGRDSGSR